MQSEKRLRGSSPKTDRRGLQADLAKKAGDATFHRCNALKLPENGNFRAFLTIGETATGSHQGPGMAR